VKPQLLIAAYIAWMPASALSKDNLPSDIGPYETDLWKEHNDAITRHLDKADPDKLSPDIEDTPPDPRDFPDMEREADPMRERYR
jgi:hypothetical protein